MKPNTSRWCGRVFREDHKPLLDVVGGAADLDTARKALYRFITERQYRIFVDDPEHTVSELSIARDCARVLRGVLARDVVSILPDGSRVYEFHPWEKNIVERKSYIGQDVPILSYLKRLAAIGEDPGEYSSMWYYYSAEKSLPWKGEAPLSAGNRAFSAGHVTPSPSVREEGASSPRRRGCMPFKRTCPAAESLQPIRVTPP